jgi:hypothetical protein
MYNYGKFMMKKEKSREKKFFNGKKDGERVIGYTFHVGYIYRADCRPSCLFETDGKTEKYRLACVRLLAAHPLNINLMACQQWQMNLP